MRGHPASQLRVQSQQELSESKFPATKILECFWRCGTRDRIVALVSISKDRQQYKPGTSPDMAAHHNISASKLLYIRERLKLLE